MFSVVLPLRAILFQLLFLLVAIAIESIVLQERLNLSRRISLEYSASINLLSTAIGWLFFFTLEPALPLAWKGPLMSYVLFNARSTNTNTLLIMLGLFTFFGTFIVELQGLELLQLLLQRNKKEEATPPKAYRARDKAQRRQLNLAATNRATTILLANACSYSAILLILLARAFDLSFKANGQI
ncbi:MAG TPA: filament integrity protein FraC [Allocoleopsis sp.]